MPDLALSFRRLLVAVFAVWLPLACCCRAWAAEEAASPGADAAAHACCAGGSAEGEDEAGADPTTPVHEDCVCDGDTRIVAGVDAAPAPPAAMFSGYLPFWGDAAASVTEGASIIRRHGRISGDSPPPAPTLRSLSVLLTT